MANAKSKFHVAANAVATNWAVLLMIFLYFVFDRTFGTQYVCSYSGRVFTCSTRNPRCSASFLK